MDTNARKSNLTEEDGMENLLSEIAEKSQQRANLLSDAIEIAACALKFHSVCMISLQAAAGSGMGCAYINSGKQSES
jgi:hypothetical protein